MLPSLRPTLLLPLLLLALVTGATGCAPALIPGTNVRDTEVNREVLQTVQRYRKAMEDRDADALRALVSQRYFENASSTGDASDDWGFPDLETVLADVKGHVKTCIYDIKVTDIIIDGSKAEVDYEYTWNFQYTDGQQDSWARKSDSNRLSLLRESDQWKIVAGM